jgi:hypothetical protein
MSEVMAKRRGNPNWGKPATMEAAAPTITEFEQVVQPRYHAEHSREPFLCFSL